MVKSFFLVLSLCVALCSRAQNESKLISYTIPSELRTNANAVVRYDAVDIEIKAYNKMIYANKRIVTILNSSGNSKHGTTVSYDKDVKIKKMEAIIYDANGKQIKKIRNKDFEDVSQVSGGTLYSDSRYKYLNYTPLSYPYTIAFETEVEYNYTAFIPQWRPVMWYHTGTEFTSYKITNHSAIPLKSKDLNFERFNIEKHSAFEYSAQNLEPIPYESYSPDFYKIAPILKVALTEFDMKGVKGTNTDWTDFGKWVNDELIQGTQELPEVVKTEIRQRTSEAHTDLEKAKIVYEYMQNKTRYISVQVGIGGWKPMPASDVDRLGYGDCKGLTSYTQALLREVGVESYYTVIYGKRELEDFDSTFSSAQGNHAILSIPTGSDYIWLECTNQKSPFGYTANFTDDREALVITPDGGKIVRTKAYVAEENILDIKAVIQLTDQGDMSADLEYKSFGSRYGSRYDIEDITQKDQILHYKNKWSYIHGLQIENVAYENNKDSIYFVENLSVSSERYAAKSGSLLLFQPNVFNRIETAPKRYANRELPFNIERGFVDVDVYEINIPDNLEVDTLMDEVSITTVYGDYTSSIRQIDSQKLVYKREFKLHKGAYSKEDYDTFRAFWLEVVKHDKSKLVLKIKS